MGGGMGMGGMGGFAMDGAAAGDSPAKAPEPMDIRQGVRSLANAGDVGELFQYSIAMPVSLPRRQSAMLPIVNGNVEGEKVSIYNPSVHPKHPLNGLRLKNTTELHLMQGPITVFDGGSYAGDAKIDDLPPKSERLVSYAMDLDTEVAPVNKGLPDEITSIRIFRGTLQVETKHVRAQEYTIKNSGKKAKKVLVEYPLDSTWTLVKPKEPTEKTRDLYRFAVDAKPGQPATLLIEEERVDKQQIAITNLNEPSIGVFMRAKVISDKVKAALTEVIKRKQAMAEVVTKRAQAQQQVQTIDQDQARIRQNMNTLDRTSDLYKRYVKNLTDQEDKLEALRGQIKEPDRPGDAAPQVSGRVPDGARFAIGGRRSRV